MIEISRDGKEPVEAEVTLSEPELIVRASTMQPQPKTGQFSGAR
jgi:hypothetical protein